MFICPTCRRTFKSEDKMRMHFLSCWREEHPGYVSKPAPRGEDIETRQTSDDILDFFSSFNTILMEPKS